jgi:hypothetical protein
MTKRILPISILIGAAIIVAVAFYAPRTESKFKHNLRIVVDETERMANLVDMHSSKPELENQIYTLRRSIAGLTPITTTETRDRNDARALLLVLADYVRAWEDCDKYQVDNNPDAHDTNTETARAKRDRASTALVLTLNRLNRLNK